MTLAKDLVAKTVLIALLSMCSTWASTPPDAPPDAPEDAAKAAKALRDCALGFARKHLARFKKESPERFEAALRATKAENEEAMAELLVKTMEAQDPAILAVAPGSAKAVAAGAFDDDANRKAVESLMKVMDAAGFPMPGLMGFAVSEYKAGTIKSGVELELCRRLLAAAARKIKKALGPE